MGLPIDPVRGVVVRATKVAGTPSSPAIVKLTMSFDRILSEETAIATLKRALASGKVHHAYLFAGPPGVGKHMAAHEMAKSLNCTEAGESCCDTCNACRKIDKAVHPDVFEVTLPLNRKSIPVDSIRDLERRFMVRPHEGRAKVVIIDPADKMTESAANALLKTLEEPGPGRYLILITNRMSSLLATVRSRCQAVRFNALPEGTVKRILIELGHPDEAASTVSALAQGSVERALGYLDNAVVERVQGVLAFLNGVVDQTPLKGIAVIEKIKQGKSKVRDEALSFVEIAPTVLSELLWIKTHGRAAAEARPLVRRFGPLLFDLSDRLSLKRIATLTFSFHHAEQAMINNNMNPQLALEGVLAAIRSPLQMMNAGSGFLRS
jgi:DNA polymerase III subunit delta'